VAARKTQAGIVGPLLKGEEADSYPDDVKDRIMWAACLAAQMVGTDRLNAGVDLADAETAATQVYTLMRIAAEEAVAKAAGYETWAAFETAMAESYLFVT